MSLDHKTSHKGQFFEIEIFPAESRINKLNKTNLNIEKIAYKVVQIKFLAMHITNQKYIFDIFMVINLQNILMEHDLYLISQWFLA